MEVQQRDEQERLVECFLFELDSRRFMYDVVRMTILELDEATWTYCVAAKNDSDASPQEATAEIYGAELATEVVTGLRKADLLDRRDAVSLQQPKAESSFHGVTLNVTHGCNLRCTYCFARQGDYGLGQAKMTKETAFKAVDWLRDHSDPADSLRVGFFGGEPLMNVGTIRATIDYANEQFQGTGRSVGFHVTTNGTLLIDRNVAFLARVKTLDTQISIDGIGADNDACRMFPSGRGSYDVVAEGIGRLKAATGEAYLRATITPGKPQFSSSLIRMIEELGATKIAFEPMSGETIAGRHLDPSDVEAIKREWDKIGDYFAEHVRNGELKPVSQLLRLLFQIHKRRKSVYGCAAGWSNVGIDPSGNIYPCHRFVGEPAWKMGNVHEEHVDNDIYQHFIQNSVDNRKSCRSCWVRYVCGGRCAHEAQDATGSITDPDPARCDLMRHMIQLALRLYIRLEPYKERFCAQE